MLIRDDFNGRSSSLWSGNVNNIEVTRLESITSFHGLHEVINETTPIPSSLFCIDLIFTNKPNIIKNSGVHPSLHRNCHHKIIFEKANIEIFHSTPYTCLVSYYSNAKVEAMNLAIESFNWENASDGNDIDAQVSSFNETILDIYSNFIRSRTKTFKDSDLS